MIQNQSTYSFPNSAQPAQATSTQPSRRLASFPSRLACSLLPSIWAATLSRPVSPPLGLPCHPHLPGLGLPTGPSRPATSVWPKWPTQPLGLLPPLDDAAPHNWLQSPLPLAGVAATLMPPADSSTPREAESIAPPALLFSKWCPAPSSQLPPSTLKWPKPLKLPTIISCFSASPGSSPPPRPL
jgi:hypothetical protein